MLFRKSASLKLIAGLTLALSALSIVPNAMSPSANAADLGISPADLTRFLMEKKSFDNYLATCLSDLEIDDIPQMDCNDINFRNPDGNPDFDNSTDYVTHAKINSVVDAVFACRWVHPSEGVNEVVPTGTLIGASGEMIVHNKVSGNTCFFKMKPGNLTRTIEGAVASTYERIPTTNPPSPTGLLGFSFWDTPSKVAGTGCTQCHAAGPWIASPQIVGALAQFGLINDGHDTLHLRYNAIGSNGAKLNQDAQDTLTVGARQFGTCTSSCHVIAGIGLRGDDFNTVGSTTNTGFIIIPSITRVITDVLQGNLMPPDDPYSEYRWVNLDNPGGAGGDWERLKDLKAKKKEFVCANGVAEVQAHVVDSARRMSTADFPDVLRTFNLLDGLACNNADQPDGHSCGDYQTRYHCSSGWSRWRNTGTPDGTGEVESRENFPSLCSAPTEIQARTVVAGSWQYGMGPPDRLQEFDLNGLACRNASQPSGQCNDYTVRFVCK
jgi:hypothetical protein